MPVIAIPLAECRDITLDPCAHEPLYQQLYHEIRIRILQKKLIAGQRLPASRVLAQELKVSRNTVQLALVQLQAEGYLETVAGSGVYVSAQIPDDYQQVISSRPKRKIQKNEFNNTTLSHYAQNSLRVTNPEPSSYKPFSPGLPDFAAFPRSLWLKLWHKHLRHNPIGSIATSSPLGLLELRQVLCDYLRYSRAVNCYPEQIVITQGAAQALDLVSRLFVNPGDTVMLEEPGYLGIRRLLLALGAKLITCPVDQHGIKLASLLQQIQQPTKLIYTTPTHQYPLGGVMPISHRLQLLAWAHKNNVYIIEDDYDSEFHYTAKPLPTLQSLDNNQQVLYVGSFSKVISPCLRLGYLVVPENLAGLLGKLKWITSGITEQVKQAVVSEFIKSGQFSRHLKRMRIAYAEKMQWIITKAKQQLSQWFNIGAHGAGMHLVIRLKIKIDDKKLLAQLKQKNIACTALSSYYFSAPKQYGLVLGFSHMQKDEILQGISTIRETMIEILELS
ncbi:MAG: PLP-dependent aminotransferase family protein [Pseudomonadota bacterium]